MIVRSGEVRFDGLLLLYVYIVHTVSPLIVMIDWAASAVFCEVFERSSIQ